MKDALKVLKEKVDGGGWHKGRKSFCKDKSLEEEEKEKEEEEEEKEEEEKKEEKVVEKVSGGLKVLI